MPKESSEFYPAAIVQSTVSGILEHYDSALDEVDRLQKEASSLEGRLAQSESALKAHKAEASKVVLEKVASVNVSQLEKVVSELQKAGHVSEPEAPSVLDSLQGSHGMHAACAIISNLVEATSIDVVPQGDLTKLASSNSSPSSESKSTGLGLADLPEGSDVFGVLDHHLKNSF